MIVRYNIYCTPYECVGVPEEDGEFVLFVPEGVVCEVVHPGHMGVAVCSDRSGIRMYTLDWYNVYMFTGKEWVKVGRVNVWMTLIESIYEWRPAIYVRRYGSIQDVSKGSKLFLLEKVAPRENCRRLGCVTDFYKAWRPKEGHTLLHLIDWAITVNRWNYFGVA